MSLGNSMRNWIMTRHSIMISVTSCVFNVVPNIANVKLLTCMCV